MYYFHFYLYSSIIISVRINTSGNGKSKTKKTHCRTVRIKLDINKLNKIDIKNNFILVGMSSAPENGVDVSAVASKNDTLNDRLGNSLDLRLNIGVSSSPSEASCAKFSRSLFRLFDLEPDSVLGVFLPAGSDPGVPPSFSSIWYIASSAQASIWTLAHNHCTTQHWHCIRTVAN